MVLRLMMMKRVHSTNRLSEFVCGLALNWPLSRIWVRGWTTEGSVSSEFFSLFWPLKINKSNFSCLVVYLCPLTLSRVSNVWPFFKQKKNY